MAQKRMFDKKVVESDKFIDLPNSAKALYFMAGMDADDKGFFQPRKLQRICGFSDDDYKILIAKRFFLTFESGVMVITDWNKNNYLDKNRISATEYIDELNMLKLINEKYEFNQCLTDVKPMFNQNSIEEYSIEENRIVESSTTASANDFVFEWFSNRNINLNQKDYEIINTIKNEYSEEDINNAFEIAVERQRYNPSYVLGILTKGNIKYSNKKIACVPEWLNKDLSKKEDEGLTDEEQRMLDEILEAIKTN